MNTRGGVALQQPFRLPPKMRTEQYKTYQIASPISTHYVKATCAEIDCEAYTNGWTFREADLDPQLLHIVTTAGKRYHRKQLTEGGEWYLVFEPGQPCFGASNHVRKTDRPELYLVGRGDWRSYQPRTARRMRAEDWVDDCQNHQATLAEAIERG